MAITTYAELQTAVSNWLGRSDLTSRIPEFISLTEPRIRRLLRDHKMVAPMTTVAGSNLLSVSSGFKDVTDLRHNSSPNLWALEKHTFEGLAQISRIGSGTPMAYAIVDGTIYFDITCDTAYSLLAAGLEKMTPLATSPNTNYTFQNSPDIYLYGALCEAGPYLEHDERVAMWEQKFAAAIEDENIARERSELAGTPTISLPVVFGDPI